MLALDVNAPIALDVTTLVFSGTCITALLGLFLLSAWAQERIRALAWWGTAYLPLSACAWRSKRPPAWSRAVRSPPR
jgi:hypothetical protein